MSTLTTFVQFSDDFLSFFTKWPMSFNRDPSSFVRFLWNVFVFPRPSGIYIVYLLMRALPQLGSSHFRRHVKFRAVFPPGIEVGSWWSFHQGTKLGSGGKGPRLVFLMNNWLLWLYADFFSFLEGGEGFFFAFFSQETDNKKVPPFFFFPFWASWITPWPMCFDLGFDSFQLAAVDVECSVVEALRQRDGFLASLNGGETLVFLVGSLDGSEIHQITIWDGAKTL